MAKCNNCKHIIEEMWMSALGEIVKKCNCAITEEGIQKDTEHNCEYYIPASNEPTE